MAGQPKTEKITVTTRVSSARISKRDHGLRDLLDLAKDSTRNSAHEESQTLQ